MVISDEREKRFRHAVSYYKGFKKGNLSIAIEEAMDLWISDRQQSEVPKTRKAHIGWS